nr:MAG TPA: hypothetical protein [Bacteriophage sp.]
MSIYYLSFKKNPLVSKCNATRGLTNLKEIYCYIYCFQLEPLSMFQSVIQED